MEGFLLRINERHMSCRHWQINPTESRKLPRVLWLPIFIRHCHEVFDLLSFCMCTFLHEHSTHTHTHTHTAWYLLNWLEDGYGKYIYGLFVLFFVVFVSINTQTHSWKAAWTEIGNSQQIITAPNSSKGQSLCCCFCCCLCRCYCFWKW